MASTKWKYAFSCLFFLFSIIGSGFAAGGFEYLPDEATLGLWHFDDGGVADISDNEVKGDIEGKGVWDENQKWNKFGRATSGRILRIDLATFMGIP